jgi:PII interaction protein X
VGAVSVERYLNHPTFGLLYRVCPGPDGQEIYATLYAQRMFFRVLIEGRGASFEAMPLLDARHLAEQNLLRQRRQQAAELPLWQKLFDQTFI